MKVINATVPANVRHGHLALKDTTAAIEAHIAEQVRPRLLRRIQQFVRFDPVSEEYVYRVEVDDPVKGPAHGGCAFGYNRPAHAPRHHPPKVAPF